MTIRRTRMSFEEEAIAAVSPFVEGLDGRFSVAFCLPGSGVVAGIGQDEEHHAASMIKLPILSCLFKEALAGSLSLSDRVSMSRGDVVEGGVLCELHEGVELTLLDLARLMIVVSDNTASNMLIDVLGFDAVNRHISEIGMSGTALVKKLMIPAADPSAFNRTTAADVCLFLRRLAEGRLVSPESDEAMIDIMSRQMFVEKIPRYLPEGVFVANKTGEVSGVRHDGAIVRAFGSQFCMAALTSESGDVNASDDAISHAAAALFCVFERRCKRIG